MTDVNRLHDVLEQRVIVPIDARPMFIRLVTGAEHTRCHRDETGAVILEVTRDATTEEVQAAIDAARVELHVECGPLDQPFVPSRRHLGPGPRQETNRERNERWRRSQG